MYTYRTALMIILIAAFAGCTCSIEITQPTQDGQYIPSNGSLIAKILYKGTQCYSGACDIKSFSASLDGQDITNSFVCSSGACTASYTSLPEGSHTLSVNADLSSSTYLCSVGFETDQRQFDVAPSCNFTPPAPGGQCNATFVPGSIGLATWDQNKPVACAPTTAPLFADAGPNDVFEFELQADFDVINDLSITRANKHLARSAGTLRYVDPNTNQTIQIPITLEARGKSRYDYCAFRPLKIVFASAQTGNIFEGASRKVKVVTHCGNHPTNPWILGGTPEEQRRRLLAEYYFYQVLETLGSTALSTRLARITYRDDDGTEIITEYAFLREREDDACVRCGFVDEAEDYDVLTPNATSVSQGTLYNKFVYNNDYTITSGHNTRRCKDASMNGFYIPYDWDLTGVVRPDYFKNGGVSYTDNVINFWNWLNTETPEVRTKIQAWHIVNHDSDMQQVLNSTLLDTEGQGLLEGWYRLYMCAQRCFLGLN